jgi:hypothetical protein
LGFYPRERPHSDTKTHFDITNAGTLQAIAEYISRDKMNETSPSTTQYQNEFSYPNVDALGDKIPRLGL